MTTEGLLADLGPDDDLASLVRRVRDTGLPWVIVADSAITAWTLRDPVGWAKVSGWLDARGIAIVRT